MKIALPIILIVCTLSSVQGQIFYRGLEKMCSTNSKGKIECFAAPQKWYHENTILIDNDSIFIYKVPLHIEKGKKFYSAADGAFYYYYGVIKQIDTSQFAYLTRHNCDYCGTRVQNDSLTGFSFPIPTLDTLKVAKGNDFLRVGTTVYKPLKQTKEFYFPAMKRFYFDSNSISRRNPQGQYVLISQAIKNFLQTKQLKLHKDTLRICIERYDFSDNRKLIEMLNPDLFEIDTNRIKFVFLTRNQLRAKSNTENIVLRYIEINEIVDYWKAARIELTYKIFLPESIHFFSEKEYSNLFEYDKDGQRYILTGELPENSWRLVEQK